MIRTRIGTKMGGEIVIGIDIYGMGEGQGLGQGSGQKQG